MPRSRNSRATSSIAATVSVTRTSPASPTTASRRRARSGSPLRFARARGLTTTPTIGTSGGRALDRELPAGRLDVLAAALAHGRVHARGAQQRLEARDARGRARGEARAGEGIEGDQVHLRPQPPQPLRQPARVGVRVVFAREHDVLEGDALAARQRHGAARRKERRERPAAVDGHQAAALGVGGGRERDREVDARFGDEARDVGHEPDGRDRDAPGRDRVAPGGRENLARRAHRLVVGERLAHAHEHDVGHGRRSRHVPAGAHLPHDLGRPQVAHEPHARGGTEGAAHAAAGLARDAEREPVAARDEHALDRGGTGQMEEELARAVGRRHDRRWREALEREVRREAGAQRSRQARHVLEAAGAAAMDPGENLSGTVPRLDWIAGARHRRALEYVAKPAALAVLLLWAATGSHPSGLLLAALAFSLIGDVLLMLPADPFLPGVAAFACAHVAYVAAFPAPLRARVAWLAVVLLAGAPASARRLRAVPGPGLRVALGAYGVLLALMTASAIASGSGLAAAGGVLFLTSDTLLAWNRFVRRPDFGHTAVMVTYHLAQLALVASLRGPG